MKLTKTLKITVTAKTKAEAEQVFEMIESMCDVKVEKIKGMFFTE